MNKEKITDIIKFTGVMTIFSSTILLTVFVIYLIVRLFV